MSSSLELSKRLRELSDEQLEQLAQARLVSSGSIRDYFDLADALLTSDSIVRALTRCSREQLIALRTVAQGESTLNNNTVLASIPEHALVGSADGSALYPEVVKVVLEVTADLAPAPAQSAPVEDSNATLKEAAALERALSVMTSLDELVRSLETHQIKELARGGLSAQDTQRLTPLMPSPDVDPSSVLALGALSGVLARRSNWWLTTTQLESWLLLPVEQRWFVAVESWVSALSPELHTILTHEQHWGDQLLTAVDSYYPLGHDWLDAELSTSLSAAELLGLSCAGVATAVGRAALSREWDRVRSAIAAVVPPYAEHVFVQHDFTVIAPGPLKPEDDAFMRQLCVVESRGLATTFRITGQGTNHLLARGTTAAQILEHLSALAATPIPQAVSYFITDLGERFGSVRVREVDGHSIVTASDPLVLRTITADHSLQSVGLRKASEQSLQSSLSAGIVLNALVEAKYPAQLEDASGNVITLPTLRREIELQPEPVSPHVALVQRLRGSRAAAASDDATWIARQLDLAVREKSLLIVTVNMPDGEREFTIEPKGFSNGRLRCVDRKTDVERTLPATHITAVRPA